MIRRLKHLQPSIHPESYIDPSAQIIGDVRIERDVSIWPGAILRGDDHNYIAVGEGSNIQDGVIGHVTREAPLLIGKNVTIGHGAILHACTIEDGARIGMGSTVLDGVVVEAGAQVGAGAVVPPGTTVPAGSLAVGVPARIVRSLTEAEKDEILVNAVEYVELWKSMYRD